MSAALAPTHPRARFGYWSRSASPVVAQAAERSSLRSRSPGPSTPLRRLELAGVEGFEGILSSPDAVDRFLDLVADVARAVEANGLFDHLDEVVLTAGGSAFFDRVAARLTAVDLGRPSRVVLRSGCYLTHDSGAYDLASPLGSKSAGDHLRPALEAWGVVLSRPEPKLAIVGFGKRDVPYDAGLPVPLFLARDGERRSVEPGCEISQVNDQHAYLRLPPRSWT